MASKLLLELLKNKNNLIEILKKLRYISKKLENQELFEWITYEIEGYKDKKDIPKYRVSESPCLYYSGINGCLKFSETPLDLNYFADYRTRNEIENLLMGKVDCSILQIEDALQDKDSKGLIIDYSFLCSRLWYLSVLNYNVVDAKLEYMKNSGFD